MQFNLRAALETPETTAAYKKKDVKFHAGKPLEHAMNPWAEYNVFFDKLNTIHD